MKLEFDANTPFDRVDVFAASRGGTRVTWSLSPQLQDDGPYKFSLFISPSGLPVSDDWTQVGDTKEETWFLQDATQRHFNLELTASYAIQLETAENSYYSKPSPCSGFVRHHDWLIYREQARQEYLNMTYNPNSLDGYLLKRRDYGDMCSCIDLNTNMPLNVNCGICYGTGIVGGYFEAVLGFYLILGPASRVRRREQANDADFIQHTIERMMGKPPVQDGDLWVSAVDDTRYYIEPYRSLYHVQRTPVAVTGVARQIELSSVLYDIPLPSAPERLIY